MTVKVVGFSTDASHGVMVTFGVVPTTGPSFDLTGVVPLEDANGKTVDEVLDLAWASVCAVAHCRDLDGQAASALAWVYTPVAQRKPNAPALTKE